jgi:hypothetical protein
MKRILGILAGLTLASAAQAANFKAAKAGNWHTTSTWGVTSIPGASDHVDLNGKAVTQTGTVSCASLVDVATGGSLVLGANVTFTCRAVTNAPLETESTGVVVDCDYKLTTGYGLTILVDGEVTIQGTWNNSGSDCGVVNAGTVTDFSGTLNNSGDGYGVVNAGTVTDFSGTLNNSGSGYGAYNNGGTWTYFTGTLNNSGSGYGAYNGGTWTDFTGNLVLSSANVEAIDGHSAIPFSGSIKIAAQPDLSAANVVTGKTILGVTGTRATGGGINGTGLLGASW